MTIDQKLSSLRDKMKKNGLDAYIIPSSDPHISEYVADHWKAREWISGFTGSAGTVIVTMEHAGLWTDSRYFLQGEQELSGSKFVLHKMIDQFRPYHIEWLKENLSSQMTIGFDGKVQTQAFYEKMLNIFSPIKIDINAEHDLFEDVWTDRPMIPRNAIYEHDVEFAGIDRTEKISLLRSKMSKHDYYLISALDEIAWLFNIRGTDVESNPVGIVYAVVGQSKSHLFVYPEKIDSALKNALNKAHIELLNYSEINQFLGKLTDSESILVDKNLCNQSLYSSIENAHIIQQDSIIKHLKAVKNDIEIAHFRNAMIKDGVALTHAFYWLEQQLMSNPVSEYDFAMKLAECRSKQEHYKGESFNAIIGYESNGAVIHYRPMPDTCKMIENKGILLCDSGGQYMDGTTDITRTIALSEPSSVQKLHYTLVLKGHISLDAAKFPKGTNGGQLDVMARQYLWSHGLNFLHGTGHGVGFFLNVHEAPQGFAPPSSERGKTVHVPGMVTTNEPGYYVDGGYGIRIENVLVTVEDADGYLKHDNITLFPIDTTLIDMSIMTKSEINWMNDYHQKVFDKLSPALDNVHKEWLKTKCKSISA